MYYGVTLDETTPWYVADTLRHLEKYKARLSKASEKAAELDEKVAAAGEEQASFYLLQSRNLARCEEQTCLNAIVKIMGGFFAKDEGGKGRELLLKVFDENVKRNKLKAKRTDVQGEYDYYIQQGKDAADKKVCGLKERLDALNEEIAVRDKSVAECQDRLDALRTQNAGDAEFARYEAMRDSGIDLARLKYSEMRLLRKDLQIIFQDPYSSLNPRLTIGQIIEEGLVTHKFYKHSSPKLREHIVETMKKCGLQEYMLHRYPHQFSGGQRQRVAIARALAVGPASRQGRNWSWC